MTTFHSKSNKVPGTPIRRKLDYDLVRSESLKDFLDPKRMEKIEMMPYWILTDTGSLWFEYVKPSTTKEELLPMIRAGIIYIRTIDARSKATKGNLADNHGKKGIES